MGFMPPMAEWLYLQICLYNWDKRAPLPVSEAKLRLSRSPTWEDDLASLVDAGKVIRTAGGGIFVERAMVEAERAFELWDKKSRGGRVSKIKRDHQDAQHSSKSVDHTQANSLASNESENEISPNGEPPLPPIGELVFNVPDQIMRAFRDHRRKIKAPLTPHAEKLIVKKLEQFKRENGHDPTEVLEQSILNGWRGVFPIKGADNGNRSSGDGRNGLFGACAE